jgi:predicted MPP superfamily phosphohydrolase
VAPFTVITAVMLLLITQIFRWIKRAQARVPSPAPTDTPAAASGENHVTRREFLGIASEWAPVALTGGLTVAGLTELQSFRVRKLDLHLNTLPPELDGLRILHFSDTHVGRYTHGQILERTIERINGLNPDLVLFTGDLINDTHKSLPEAMQMLGSIRSAEGLYLCEGNHDLLVNQPKFRQTVLGEGFNLLVGQERLLTIRGVPVAIRGLDWYQSSDGNYLPKPPKMGAFRICLSHHPHAFDNPKLRHYELMLAGHTHGGQLMATPRFGFGSLLFRYWSGVYQKEPGRALIVSNGLGNWFPLRVNAPAEIALVTLRRPVAAQVHG